MLYFLLHNQYLVLRAFSLILKLLLKKNQPILGVLAFLVYGFTGLRLVPVARDHLLSRFGLAGVGGVFRLLVSRFCLSREFARPFNTS